MNRKERRAKAKFDKLESSKKKQYLTKLKQEQGLDEIRNQSARVGVTNENCRIWKQDAKL